jgi:1-deoxy-D-xylulose-5-phosphate synthase
MHPRDEAELANMLHTALRLERPVVVRYPRGRGPGAELPDSFVEIPVGRAEILRPGRAVQLWALGDMVPAAVRCAALLQSDGIDTGVVNARFVRPLDRALLAAQASAARLFVTIENGVLAGGFGSGVAEALIATGYRGTVLRFGWPDEFVPHGAGGILMAKYGLTGEAMAAAIKQSLAGLERGTLNVES